MAQMKNVKQSKKPITPGLKVGAAQGATNTLNGKANTKASTNKAC